VLAASQWARVSVGSHPDCGHEALGVACEPGIVRIGGSGLARGRETQLGRHVCRAQLDHVVQHIGHEVRRPLVDDAFLAVLEMAKERLLTTFQAELFGPIEVRLREEEEILRLQEEAAAEAIEPAEKFLLEGDPHSVLEGILIGAYAIGAPEGYLYIRAEYPLAIERIEIIHYAC